MKNLFVLTVLAVLLAPALPANAQDETTRLEAYGGYDYARFHVNARVNGIPPALTFNGNGGGGQLQYNANNWIGTVAYLGGFGVTSTTNGALIGGAFTYLFGPRMNLRRGKVTPFIQALFGGIRTTSGIGHSGLENHFAMTAGGGIDFRVSGHISVRPVEAEYFMTTIPDGLDNRQNNLRLSAGIVLRFGRG
jgi:opacity protein-like surface antigen